MKFTSLPFSDVYGNCAWARHPVFDGYLAVIPTEGALADRGVKTVRLNNLRHVLDCALPALERLVKKTKTPKDAAAARRLVRTVRRFRVKPRLPSVVRLHFHKTIRTGRLAVDHRRVMTYAEPGPSQSRWVKLADLIAFGVDEALSRAYTPTPVEEA